MNSLAAKIRATLEYTAFFKFPLTKEEIWRWLVTPKPVSLEQIERSLAKINLPAKLRHLLITRATTLRRNRARTSHQKLIRAQLIAEVIGKLPGVRLVALTGSAAVGNSRANDDVDLMIVTAANTLWLVRPWVVGVVELMFRRRHPKQQKRLRDSVCLNLWLDESGLKVPVAKHNLYTAHEVLQLVPLVNKGHTYEKFLASNLWVGKFLANALTEKQLEFQLPAKTVKPANQSVLASLNWLAFWVQYRYMAQKITRETVSLHTAYFHPQDWYQTMQPQF